MNPFEHEHVTVTHKLDDEQFKVLVGLLVSNADAEKIAALVKTINASSAALKTAVDQNKPK